MYNVDISIQLCITLKFKPLVYNVDILTTFMKEIMKVYNVDILTSFMKEIMKVYNVDILTTFMKEIMKV